MLKLSPSNVRLKIITPSHYLESKDSEDIILVDVRRLIEYKTSHIPNAISMPFTNFIKMEGLALYPADAEKLTRQLYRNGITPDKLVICYDNLHGRQASRVLYTLELLGYENLGILSTTYDKYIELGYKAEKETSKQPSTTPSTDEEIKGEYKMDRVVTKEKILDLIDGKQSITLIDTRDSADFLFLRIPSSLNLPWHEVVSDKTFFNLDRVTRFVEDFGISRGEPIIFYCEEGTSSSLVMYAFRELVYWDTHTYLPSFSEWISYPQLPVYREKS